jgi:hypothetical protein
MGPSVIEQQLDEKFQELEQKVHSSNGVINLMMQVQHRPDFEEVVKGYYSLYTSKRGSDHIVLKILKVLDRLRSPDFGRLSVRFARIGDSKKRVWESKTISQKTPWYRLRKHRSTETRNFRSTNLRDESPLHKDNSNMVDFIEESASGKDILDFSKVIVLHFGFIGDDLLVTLDSNLGEFVYGLDSLVTDNKIRANSFSDYEYNETLLSPYNVIFGPKLIAGAKPKIQSLSSALHGSFNENPGINLPPGFVDTFFQSLDEAVGAEEIMSAIEEWASKRKYSLKDVCLLIAPVEDLFTLPLPFIGHSLGQSLISRIGGVSIILSLLSFKWNVKDYHWTGSININKKNPRITFFSAQDSEGLDLAEEANHINKIFGKKNCRFFDGNATRSDFVSNYSAGDICWFAGHGAFDSSTVIQLEENLIKFPLSGPVFKDGVITNLSLLTTSHWNFKSLWLTVFNCCVIGKSIAFGPNPLGFVSCLYSTGGNSIIASVLPVNDDDAINFSKELSRQITKNYDKKLFARAFSFGEAIRNCIGSDYSNLRSYFGYTFWGNI